MPRQPTDADGANYANKGLAWCTYRNTQQMMLCQKERDEVIAESRPIMSGQLFATASTLHLLPKASCKLSKLYILPVVWPVVQ